MALIDRVRLRVPSDLPDSEIAAMIEALEAEIDARLGPAGPITVALGDPLAPRDRLLATLRLNRPADPGQPISITEICPGNGGAAAEETLLDAADFAVLHGGRTLLRLTGGPHPSAHWAPRVRVTYTPAQLAAAREEAVIKLIALDLSYRGALRSERAGDYQFALSGDMAADREAILRSLEDRRGMVMA